MKGETCEQKQAGKEMPGEGGKAHRQGEGLP
eukprot:CAMPEP_0173290076 /NCGR_PEP_ID=MMETSP1143-20121109/11362_1 /TAXON_ID=483371 /ORGANISM="non described non described, Strain CCMP2298" /LENGTH=30 /DNA_ID= /DNA_START= /DNA_END= /DNA_ORIENTATION=